MNIHLKWFALRNCFTCKMRAQMASETPRSKISLYRLSERPPNSGNSGKNSLGFHFLKPIGGIGPRAIFFSQKLAKTGTMSWSFSCRNCPQSSIKSCLSIVSSSLKRPSGQTLCDTTRWLFIPQWVNRISMSGFDRMIADREQSDGNDNQTWKQKDIPTETDSIGEVSQPAFEHRIDNRPGNQSGCADQ